MDTQQNNQCLDIEEATAIADAAIDEINADLLGRPNNPHKIMLHHRLIDLPWYIVDLGRLIHAKNTGIRGSFLASWHTQDGMWSSDALIFPVQIWDSTAHADPAQLASLLKCVPDILNPANNILEMYNAQAVNLANTPPAHLVKKESNPVSLLSLIGGAWIGSKLFGKH